MVTLAIIVAVFGAGFLTGAVVTATAASAAMHRSQVRMQRKVRVWQARSRLARQFSSRSRLTL